jgi:teichoic acid transport system permease protein
MSFFSSTQSARVQRLAEYLTELWRRREFAIYLGLGNLKAKNASTALGLVWWIINPLLLGGVYFLVFGLFFQRDRPAEFLAYLLSGMFVFHFTSQSLTGGANSILSNAKLLVNLRFPRLILPISALIESGVGFLASIGVFYLITLPLGEAALGYRLLYLPFVVALHSLFNLGLACLSARLVIPFRDINNLIPYVNRIWLYITPIIWPLSFLDGASDRVNSLIQANPMFHMVGLYRAVLFNTPIHMSDLIWSIVSATLVGGLGIALFIRHEGHMVRHL